MKNRLHLRTRLGAAGLLLLLLGVAVPSGGVWARNQRIVEGNASSLATVGQPTSEPVQIAQPVTIGPLALEAAPASDGRSVTAIVRLQNVAVGAQTLTAPFPSYTFTVTVGTASANGTLTALFMPPGQISTVRADVSVEVQGQAKQPFVGLVQTFQVPSPAGQ